MIKMRYVFLLLFTLNLLTTSFSVAEQFVIVVHPDNPVTSLTQADIRKIFLGRRAFWENGHKIDVYLQTSNNLHTSLVSQILNKSIRQFKIYWRRELYSGTGIPPQQFSDEQDLIAQIATNPTAIGYISSESLDDRVKPITISSEP